MSDTRSHSDDLNAEGRGADGAGPATVQVNGARLDWPETGTLALLLDRLGMQGKRVAVSINRSVIPRSHHGEAQVRAGDRIEILEAVGGG